MSVGGHDAESNIILRTSSTPFFQGSLLDLQGLRDLRNNRQERVRGGCDTKSECVCSTVRFLIILKVSIDVHKTREMMPLNQDKESDR